VILLSLTSTPHSNVCVTPAANFLGFEFGWLVHGALQDECDGAATNDLRRLGRKCCEEGSNGNWGDCIVMQNKKM